MYNFYAMKISKNLKKEINILSQTKEININIADMLLSTFPYPEIVTKKHILDAQNEKEGVFTALLDYFGIEKDDEESMEIANRYIYYHLQECDPKDYLNNEYVKKVNPKAFKENGYSLEYLSYAPYQVLPTDEILVTDYPYEEHYQVGFFKEEFKYLALLKGEEIWMSVNPNEINTMKPFINEAKGKVLVLGLGMGYIAYMMSLKEDVKSVTVIEKDINIINLFKKNILPMLDTTKIKVVHDDAFRYIENNNGFDYVFADMWHNPEDGIPMYLQLEAISKKQNIKIHYWLEPSLKAMRRRCLITILEEYFMGYTDKDYKFAKNQIDQTVNYLFKQIKDLEIDSLDKLKRLLD